MRIGFDGRYVRWDHHDGISRFSAGLARELAQLVARRPDLELVLIVSDSRQIPLLPSVETLLVSSPTSAREPWVAHQVNRADLDVVFSPMQTMGSWGRKYRLILTVHDLIYFRHRTPPPQFAWPLRLLWRLYHLFWWPQRRLLNRSDGVVAVSRTTADLIAAHHLSKRPVFVVPNAADLPSVTTAPRAFASRSKQAVYMGSFMPYKNVETIARTASLRPEWQFHFLSRIAPKTREALMKLVSSDNVIFHNGTSEDEYQQILNDSRALISASLDEGFGIPLIEAMAAGTPVVVSDIEIFHEVAGDAALFATPTDPLAFASALDRLDDGPTWEALSRASRAQAKTFSWRASAERLLDVLDEVGGTRGLGERTQELT